MAIEQYKEGLISLGKMAEFLSITKQEAMHLLNRLDIEWLEYEDAMQVFVFDIFSLLHYNESWVNIDEIKEQIGWLKIVFGLLTAVNIGLIGWLVKNYDEVNYIFVYLALAIVFLCTAGIICVNKKAYKKIRELRDL